jgi:argininosuccinate synthase
MNQAQNEIIVLAFSGGLDTSYCVRVLLEQGFRVHTAFVNAGGVNNDQSRWIRDRAMSLGAEKHHEIDAAADIWDEFVIPLVWSGARMLGEYPMLCSDRYVIVRRCLDLCQELGTRHFAHGCTGMGNDQLRFDQTVRSLGDYELHAPIRDLQRQTNAVRDHEIEVLSGAGFDIPLSSQKYSINENLLGVTISGSEIDEFGPPGEDTWQMVSRRPDWPIEPVRVRIGFQGGVATTLNGEALRGPELLGRMNEILGSCGVGRHIYTGDVSIGLKGRIVFECPGIDGLLLAHQALEDTVNTRLQNQFRSGIANRWAELVYTGFFYDPHKFDLEAYLSSSQEAVSGSVTLESCGGSLQAVAVESENLLQDPDAVYAQSCHWTPEEAEGFIKLIGQSTTLAARRRLRQKKA